jgi:2-methylisocitrate lyase-like PEP mutase family enzyme
MSANQISAESQRALTPTQLRQLLRAKLKQAQQGGPAVVAPGVFDGYGARMVQQLGFEAVYMLSLIHI